MMPSIVLFVSVLCIFASPDSAEVLLDNLCIVDQQIYRGSYYSFCGGEAVYGVSYNIQAADEVVLEVPYWITRVTVDFLASNGDPPDHVCVRFYEHLGGRCNLSEHEYAAEELRSGEFAWSEFDDVVFDKAGRRLDARLEPMVLLPEGVFYLSAQPSSPSNAFDVPAAYYLSDACFETGDVHWRDGRKSSPCCEAVGEGGWPFWDCTGSFEPDTLSMRVEGIPAGDCVGGEGVTARCKPGDGKRLGKVVVTVRGGQVGGTVTALLDPPDPRDIRIPLDDRGRGKGRFRDVDDSAAHRVFVCDAVLDVPCGR